MSKLKKNKLKVTFFACIAGSFILLFNFSLHTVKAGGVVARHGTSVFQELKYPKDFTHFDYVNPNAPKQGRVKIAEIGSYDSLNAFLIKGVAEQNLSLLYDTLMQNSADEAASAYGLIASKVYVSDDKKSITFTINNNAKFADGSKITADDVVITFKTLTEKGHPYYQTIYREVDSAHKISDNKVKFNFKNAENKELPLIVGQLPVLSKKWLESNDFDKAGINTPLGSGPYKIKSYDIGRSVTYELRNDYWAKDLPVNKGRFNFKEIVVDYYRDTTVAVEAIKAGEYDFRKENISKTWKKAYDVEQVKNGQMVKEELADGVPTGMQSFVFNLRKPKFQNPKIREAISYAYDFEWANKQLFFDAYKRNTSFFGNSDFASTGLPSKGEVELLSKFKDDLPKRLFTEEYVPPTTDGLGNNRANLLKARDLIKEAGWKLRDMKLIDPSTNEPFTIEFMLGSPSFERVVAPFVRNLKKLGIDSTIKTVDSAQYVKRIETFDFDMMVYWFTQGSFPGNEQVNYWHSSKADQEGSRNIAGIKNPAVDYLVEKVVKADNWDELVTSARALDRVLLWNFYVIPQWYSQSHRIIYWNKFSRPKITPPYSLGFLDTWWIDNDKLKKLKLEREGDVSLPELHERSE